MLSLTRNLHRAFASSPSKLAVVPFLLADIGEGIREVELLKWFVGPGDRITEFMALCEVESDKATVEITCPFEGSIVKIHAKEGGMAKVGEPLCDIDTNASAKADPVPVKHPVKALAAPAVRRIARENQISLADVHATGKVRPPPSVHSLQDGRVTKSDILAFLDASPPPVDVIVRPPPVIPPPPPPAQTVQAASSSTVESLRGPRRTMLRTMTEANKIPHFSLFEEIEADRLIELRQQLKHVALDQQVNLTYLPFIIKAFSLALNNHPILNSRLLDNMEEVELIHDHNIGIAVDTPRGLVVPNIKSCQNKSILEIAKEADRLITATQEQHLSLDDVKDGTFTISNIGSIAGTYAKAMLMPPEVALMVVGRFVKMPRYDNQDNLVPKMIQNYSLNCDHRVVDGATSARFIRDAKAYLENPASMLMYLR